MTPANASVPHLERPAVSAAPPLSERRQRVLVVHADDERRDALVRIVVQEGWESLDVADAEEVLRLAAEYDPDLILMDVNLPEISGYEVCGELRSNDLQGHTPVLLLADPPVSEQDVARGLLAGADDFITAPDRLLELRARMRVQLRNKRFRDALARVRSERDHLRRDASIDPLTGVLNRRTLERVIDEAFQKGERFALLFADVDHFKRVNDQHGHDAGDRVLKLVADWLKAGIRPGDHCGRYGGEEFVLVVAGAGRESARLVAERHRRAIECLDPGPGAPDRVTISIGVAVYDPRRPSDAGALLQEADAALYEAKRAGRNCVVMATGSSPSSSRRFHTTDPPLTTDLNTLRALRTSMEPPVTISELPTHTAPSPTFPDFGPAATAGYRR